MTVKEVIEKIKKESGASIPDGQTCDILISGEPDMEVKKIGCTFMATVDVIREAAAQGVNFLITHEPTDLAATNKRLRFKYFLAT